MDIILASRSPRRKELLSRIFKNFSIEVSDADETLSPSVTPEHGVEILAVRKGSAVAASHPDAIVISSDTLVEIDGASLGKPKDEADAAAMLGTLSGRQHFVRTGVAVHYRGKICSGVASTGVTFRLLSDEEIKDYIATGEPMDKAGSYGIQGIGGKFVTKYDGDFDTVMGLSLALTIELLEEATGLSIEEIEKQCHG